MPFRPLLLFGLYLLHTVHSGGVSRGKVCGCGCWPRWHVLGETWRITSDYFCFAKTQPSGPSLSISWFVRLCVCVSVHFLSVPFKRPFAPTSQNPMSKMFRDSESLGKSIAKIGLHIWKLLLIKGVKFPQRKKFFPNYFFGTSSLRKPTSYGLETSGRRAYH